MTPRGFTNHEHLGESGLIHINVRAYDPELGRFLSVDPFIVFPDDGQSLNPYSYVMNNPLKYTDPSGYASVVGNGSDTEVDASEITSIEANSDGTFTVTAGDSTYTVSSITVISKSGGSSRTTTNRGGFDGARSRDSKATTGSATNDPGIPIAQQFTRAERVLEWIDPTTNDATGKDTGINANNIRSYNVIANPAMAFTLVEKAQIAAVLAKAGVRAAETLAKHILKKKMVNVRAATGRTDDFVREGTSVNNFIMGTITNKGVVDFAIEAGKGASIRGGELFKSMMSHFGSNVKGIAGNWTYGSNLARVNELTAVGMSLEKAIAKTLT